MKTFKSKVDKILDKKVSRKKFLQILGVGAVSIPLLSPSVAAKFFLRQSDGTLIDIDDLSPDGGIGGSGSNNELAIWDGNNSLTSSSGLSWDGSNLSVGGTVSANQPSANSHLATKGYVDSKITEDGSNWNLDGDDVYRNSGRVGIGTNTLTDTLTVSGDSWLGGDTAIDGDLGVANDLIVNANTLFVDSSSERTGIGTSNPSSTLHVDGDLRLASGTSVNDISTNTSLGTSNNSLSTTGAIKAYVDSQSGDASGSAEWGNIGGTLSNQTDLQEELDNKADESDLTSHTNDEDIHFTQSQISITESQISDLGNYAETDGDYSNLRARATTKDDVGLSNVTNDEQATKTEFDSHTGDSDIHFEKGDVSKSDVGLSNVPNWSGSTDPELGTSDSTIPSQAAVKSYVDSQSGDASGSAEWGNIGGTLSNQTDLQEELDDKADDDEVVKLSGSQTINGVKTFNDDVNINGKTTSEEGFETGQFEIVYNSDSESLDFNFLE